MEEDPFTVVGSQELEFRTTSCINITTALICRHQIPLRIEQIYGGKVCQGLQIIMTILVCILLSFRGSLLINVRCKKAATGYRYLLLVSWSGICGHCEIKEFAPDWLGGLIQQGSSYVVTNLHGLQCKLNLLLTLRVQCCTDINIYMWYK